MALMGRSTTAPASGEDTLDVRQSYLRKRHARHAGIWRHAILWVVVGAIGCWLCVAGIGGLLLG